MEEERFPEFPKDKESINDSREPKIFDVSDERLDRPCWPSCSPCSPSDDCSPDVLCTPDLREDWSECRPCSPNGNCRPDTEDYGEGWSNCSPCSPTDDCSPDFSDDGK